MSNSTFSPTKSQVTKLTRIQRQTIDRLLAKYPGITPQSVRSTYEHYCFARNWFVYIELDRADSYAHSTITRCDHSWTAASKAQAVRRYIEEKLGGVS